MTTLALALAGGLGAATRFVVDTFLARRNPYRTPLGTLVVNLTGSFVLGLLTSGFLAGPAPSTGATIRLVIGTGFCGGYTTFSTACVEAARLWSAEGRGVGARYAAATLVGSVIAAAAGLGLGHLIVGWIRA